jgi:hypothetical protein
MVGAGRFEKLLKVIGRLPRLALEVTLNSSDEFLIEVISLLVITVLVVAGSDHDSLGLPLCPLLLPLALLFVPLPTAMRDAPRSLLGAAFLSRWMKTDMTASSLEECLVAMLSSAFVVFN